jgi:hypothetical protein
VDALEIGRWFDGYREAFSAYGRGDVDDPRVLLGFYNVPLLLTTDDGFLALTGEDEVTQAVRQLVAEMRAAGYERSVLREPQIAVLNSASILYQGEVSRLRRDGTEIQRARWTYLVVQTLAGPRIAALAMHSA